MRRMPMVALSASLALAILGCFGDNSTDTSGEYDGAFRDGAKGECSPVCSPYEFCVPNTSADEWGEPNAQADADAGGFDGGPSDSSSHDAPAWPDSGSDASLPDASFFDGSSSDGSVSDGGLPFDGGPPLSDGSIPDSSPPNDSGPLADGGGPGDSDSGSGGDGGTISLSPGCHGLPPACVASPSCACVLAAIGGACGAKSSYCHMDAVGEIVAGCNP
jgi:hypothetical protein